MRARASSLIAPPRAGSGGRTGRGEPGLQPGLFAAAYLRPRARSAGPGGAAAALPCLSRCPGGAPRVAREEEEAARAFCFSALAAAVSRLPKKCNRRSTHPHPTAVPPQIASRGMVWLTVHASFCGNRGSARRTGALPARRRARARACDTHASAHGDGGCASHARAASSASRAAPRRPQPPHRSPAAACARLPRVSLPTLAVAAARAPRVCFLRAWLRAPPRRPRSGGAHHARRAQQRRREEEKKTHASNRPPFPHALAPHQRAHALHEGRHALRVVHQVRHGGDL
jgi:hypothetical protein